MIEGSGLSSFGERVNESRLSSFPIIHNVLVVSSASSSPSFSRSLDGRFSSVEQQSFSLRKV